MAQTFPCPSCGADLEWQPGQGLACAHCGHEGPAPASEGVAHLEEIPLDQAALQAARGYGTETRELACSSCGAISELSAEITSTSCPFCGSHHAELVEDGEELIRPGSVLPFAIPRAEAVRAFRDWISGLWFRPNALKRAAQLEHIHGVYLPAWTFDAQARSRWTAEAGHHYYEEEEVTRVVDGERKTTTERVRKTRWEPASGQHQARYDDRIVQASGGISQAAIKGLLPFPLEELRPYDAAYLAGFQAERYAVDLEAAWEVAEDELEDEEESACAREVPGDTHRNLQVHTRFSAITFKHTLLPVWIAAYRYQGTAYRYLVNGATGKADGEAPISYLKVALFVLFLLALFGLCLGLASGVGLYAS